MPPGLKVGRTMPSVPRHALLAHSYAERFPESFSETIAALTLSRRKMF